MIILLMSKEKHIYFIVFGFLFLSTVFGFWMLSSLPSSVLSPTFSLSEILDFGLGIVNFIAGIFAMIVIALSIQMYGKSPLGNIFLYFIFGTVSLTLVRLFLFL